MPINFIPDTIQPQPPAPTPSPVPQPSVQFTPDQIPASGRSVLDDFGRYGQIAARELTPAALATGAGAATGLMGGPFASVTVPAGATAGLASYGLSRLLGNPAIELTNAATGMNIPTFAQGEEALKNTIYGQASAPQTSGERIFASGVQGLADAASGYGMGGMALQSARPMMQNIGKTLTQTPVADTFLGGFGGLGIGTAQEAAPNNPLVQIGAGVALPMAAGLGVNAVRGVANVAGGPSAWASWLTGNIDEQGRRILNLADPAAKLEMRGGPLNRQAPAMRSAMDRVAQEMQTAATASGEDINTAIANIDESMAALNTSAQTQLPAGLPADMPLSPGFRVTTGLASNNVGLGMMEKGMSGANPRIQLRNLENQQAINRESAQVVSPTAGYDDTQNPAQDFVRNLLRNKTLAARQGEAAAQAGVTSAQADLAAAQADLATQRADIADASVATNRATASEQLRRTLTAEQNAATQAVDERFALVPQDVAVNVSENTVKQLQNTMAAYQGRIAEMPAAVQSLFDIISESGGQLASGTAQKNLQDLYAFASRAPAGSVQGKVLNDLRNALDADISKVEEVSIPLREARDFYRNEFIPRFKSGASFDVMYGRGKGNIPTVAPSQTAEQYLQGGTPESARQLMQALTFSTSGKVSVTDEKALTDWVASSLGAKAGQNATPERIQKFLNDNAAILGELPPSVTNKIQDIANNLQGAIAKQAGAETAVQTAGAQAKAASAKVKAAENISPELRQFANPDFANTGFANAVRSQNPITNVRRLLKVAAKDKTGEATKGVKNAARQYYSELWKNRGSTTRSSFDPSVSSSADNATSLAKLSKQLEEDDQVLSLIFSSDEMAALKQSRNQLNALTRQNRQIGTGSSTKPTEGAQSFLEELASESAGRGTTIANVPGVRQLRQVNTIAQAFKTIAGRAIKSGKEEQFYNDLKVEAMLNPEIAKLLLKRVPAKPAEYVSVLKKPAMVTWMQAWDRENNDEDRASKPRPQASAPTSRAAVPRPQNSAPSVAAPKRFRYEGGKLVPVE